MNSPKLPGWYWFLPDANCPTPTGLLRIDRPVILLVGPTTFTRGGDGGPLVVRFPQCVLRVDEMTGDWELTEPPRWMVAKAQERWPGNMAPVDAKDGGS